MGDVLKKALICYESTDYTPQEKIRRNQIRAAWSPVYVVSSGNQFVWKNLTKISSKILKLRYQVIIPTPALYVVQFASLKIKEKKLLTEENNKMILNKILLCSLFLGMRKQFHVLFIGQKAAHYTHQSRTAQRLH